MILLAFNIFQFIHDNKGLLIVVLFLALMLWNFQWELYSWYKFNRLYRAYPMLQDFERDTTMIARRLLTVATMAQLKDLLPIIEGLPAKYNGEIPPHILKETMRDLRNEYFQIRKGFTDGEMSDLQVISIVKDVRNRLLKESSKRPIVVPNDIPLTASR